MKNRSRSTLFLMEQLIVITIFAICASTCVKIFIGSYLMAEETRDLKRALIVAKNGAESFKAYGGLDFTVLSGREYSLDGSSEAVVYYDGEWRVCGEAEAAFVLRGAVRNAGGGASPLLCDLSVTRITGEEIVGFAVAARQGAP